MTNESNGVLRFEPSLLMPRLHRWLPRRCAPTLRNTCVLMLLAGWTVGVNPADHTPLNAGGDQRSTIVNEDRRALEALYHATGGHDWRDREGWLTDEPIGSWAGVVVHNGRVVELTLMNNRLVGSLPPELGNLSRLTQLELPGNELGGTIPEEVGNLSALVHLDLRWNSLEGEIPTTIGHLNNLMSLLLSSNRLSGSIPPGIGSLRILRRLELSHNELAGTIPRTLGSLRVLEAMALQHNFLEGPIPEEFGRISSIKRLNFQQNRLTGQIPRSFGSLHEVEFLNVAGNQFSGTLPPGIGTVASKTVIQLDLEQCHSNFHTSDSPNTSYVCGVHKPNIEPDGEMALAEMTVEMPTSEKLVVAGMDVLRAIVFRNGFAELDYARVPTWLPFSDAEVVVRTLNEHLLARGIVVESVQDFVRAIETYEGPLFIPELPPEHQKGRQGSVRILDQGKSESDRTIIVEHPGSLANSLTAGLVATGGCGSNLEGPVRGYDGFASAEADVQCATVRLKPEIPEPTHDLSLNLERRERWLIFSNWILYGYGASRRTGFFVNWVDKVLRTTWCPNGFSRLSGEVHVTMPSPYIVVGSPATLDAGFSNLSGCKKPPGSCKFVQFGLLNDNVNTNCHNPDPRSCSGVRDCNELRTRHDHFDSCLTARLTRENACFGGGDSGHRRQIDSIEDGRSICRRQFRIEGCPGTLD